MEDICVVGLGALGVFYSYLLERAGKARVTAVCRSNFELLSGPGPGIHLKSDALDADIQGWKPFRAVKSCDEANDRKYSVVVCCFKALPDIITTPELIKPLLSASSTFLLIQNGVSIELDLQRALPTSANVISACAWIDSTTLDGGKVVRQTGATRVTIGEHKSLEKNPNVNDSQATIAVKHIAELLRAGGGIVEESKNIQAARWRKLLWNASLSTLCTLTRCNIATNMQSSVAETTTQTLRDIMNEVLAVAHGSGISSPELTPAAIDAIIDDTRTQYGTSNPNPSQFRPSMLVDLDHGRPMEVEAIVGGVVRAGRAAGVLTPRLDLIYAALRTIQGTLVSNKVEHVAAPV